MAKVDIVLVRKRVLEKLLASPLAARYTDAIGTNAEYPMLAEITDTIIDIDALLILAHINVEGDPVRAEFMAEQVAKHGDYLNIDGDIDVDPDGNGSFKPARYASSRAEIMEIIANPTLYPDAKRWVFVEDSRIFTPAKVVKVWHSNFVKGDVCQAPEFDTLAEIAGTISALEKDGGNTSFFARHGQYLDWHISNNIKGESQVLPDVEAIETSLRQTR